ncbi:DsrE family protein [Runella salmonicolor]|uniref:DsrE family protein n=1 Tax=Runella salmonicolor TaxID=2950278 RepID=A0ABT1G0N5_9BACT|nr:DsrE family protein [Runella salmonicolor]MCP1386297.1 DsrE family protein [Runella salmonicolor]
MKSLLFIFAFTGILFVNQAIGQTPEKEHRIVFHLASADTLVHKALVKQLGNVLDYWKTAKIEVVVHNAGVGFMKKDEAILSKEIELLKERGIVFAVCENTLKQRKIAKNQILPAAIFVPVGLAEIVLRQEEGWSYIKAGF